MTAEKIFEAHERKKARNRVGNQRRYEGLTEEQRARHRAKSNASMKRWYSKRTPEQKREIHRKKTAREKKKRKANPVAYQEERRRVLLRGYGLTVENYEQMRVSQDYRCALCGIHERECVRQKCRQSLVVDHSHSTGKVRPLLCHQCNTAIGMLREDVRIALAAAQYIQRWI